MRDKNRFRKMNQITALAGSGILGLCIAAAIVFAVFQTNASEKSTGKEIQYLSRTYVQDISTLETPDGYLFGGWYTEATDSEGKTAYAAVSNPEENGAYYAKFVPEEVLGIKAQISASLFDNSEAGKAGIRFVTSIDSTKYRKVGFELQIDGIDETARDVGSNKVYKTLYAVDATSAENAGEPEGYSPDQLFHSQSEYFKTWTVRNVPAAYYNTDFTVKPYWVTLDGTRVYGTQSIKTVNLGRSWVYVDANGNTDGKAYGTFDHPYTKLEEALNGIHLATGGKVIAKGENPITVPADFTWTNHTVTVNGEQKKCDITITGEKNSAGLDFSAVESLGIGDDVTFTKMTLKFQGTSADCGKVYANGNRFEIAGDVISENQYTTILGGGNETNVEGDTSVTLLAGSYKCVYGGGENADVSGNTHIIIKNANIYNQETDRDNRESRVFGGSCNGGNVTGSTYVTIGEGFNEGLGNKYTAHEEWSAVYGGCGIEKAVASDSNISPKPTGIVRGDTNVMIEGSARINYVYGGGRDTSVEGTCFVTMENGNLMSIYGGAAGNGKNKNTSVIMKGGNVAQIFGGNQSGMTGNTYVEIAGGSVSRRVYGGCYNGYTVSGWESHNSVNGYTTVVVKDSSALIFNSTDTDISLCAGSRREANAEDEIGVLIFPNDLYDKCKGKIGHSGSGTGNWTFKPYNYLIDAAAGGTVEANGKMLLIKPESLTSTGTVAFKDNNAVQVYFNADCSWPMVNAGAAAQKDVKVDFNAAPVTDTSAYEASIDEIYYAQLEDAVDAANVRTDQPTVMVLKDADVERVMTAENGADFTVQSEMAETESFPIICGGVNTTNDEGETVRAANLFHALAGGNLTLKNLKLKNGYNAIAAAGMVTVNHVEIESPENAGLSVSGGATVNDLTITNAGGNGIAVVSDAKADITNLTVNGTGLAAVRTQTASGKSGEVTINGGNITTGAYGIVTDGTGKATITNVNVTATGNSPAAVYVANKANLKVDGGNITASGDKTFGIWMDGGIGIIKNATIKADKESAICAETRESTLDNADLTLDNVKIERTESNGKALVSVREQAKVTMQGETSKIDGKRDASFAGRGVEVQGTFHLEGGTIANHKAAGETALVTANVTDGSGVYVVNGGTFRMSGGYMEGNDTANAGSAVSVNGTDATFILNGGEIRNNKAIYGAVIVRNGLFNMHGGKITGNTASTGGGGVAVSQGTFTMYGGEISRNTAKAGGGVFANNGNGKIILAKNSTGKITDNEATATANAITASTTSGGGIALAPGNLEMHGGSITNNTASGIRGGGVDVNHANATFELTGGIISGNSGKYGGGGVSIRACKSAVMSGGTIENNRGYLGDTIPGSGAFGGGIFLSNTGLTFEMNGGAIINNSARNCAAICVYSGDNAATVKYGGGTIQGNKAVAANNGNGIKSHSSTKPGTIIYLNNTSAADIADGVMTMTVGSQN